MLRPSLFLTLLLAATPLVAQTSDPWAVFTPGTLARVIREESPGIDSMPSDSPGGSVSVTAKTWPQRVTVVFTGRRRPLSEGSRKVLEMFSRTMTHDTTFPARFANEYLFTENGVGRWIPVQVAWEALFLKEHPAPSRVTLLTRWLGTFTHNGAPQWVFVANNYEDPPFDSPPSQYELNGWLLGQQRSAIEHAFGAPFQTIPHEDGWLDAAYLVDRSHHAYMGFKFAPDHPDLAIAVQIAGDPGTPMLPFLGIRLGTTRREIEARFGPPTEVTHEDDVNVDLLVWAGRNYSFEVDTAGRVNSIQILGFEGIREETADSEPDPLARFRSVLGTGSTDSLLAVLAPDVGFFHDTSAVRFTQAPRTELEAASSAMRKELGKVAAAIRATPTESAVRVQENVGLGLVYKWGRGSVQELFFKWFPGGYRLWEVRFR